MSQAYQHAIDRFRDAATMAEALEAAALELG